MSWIKLHRSLLTWEWYDDHNATRLLMHLLLSVNYEDKKWKGQVIKAGSMVLSWETLASNINLSTQQLRTAMSKLESSGEVTRKATNKYQLVTLVKWDELQSKDAKDNKQTNRQSTNKQQSNNKQVTTTKESKEDKELKEGKEDAIDFDNFWTAYDYKKNKDKAKVKWDQLKPKDQKDILAYLPAYVKSTPDKQYRKHPATFLNNRGWEDEIIQIQPKLNNQPQQQTRSSIPVC